MRVLACFAFTFTFAFAFTSSAQTPLNRPEAIEVDRDQTPPGQAELGFDGGGSIGNWALGAELGLLEHPIRFHTVNVKTYPVLRRETVALGGALALGDDVIVDARMPLAHQVGQRLQSSVDCGDLRTGFLPPGLMGYAAGLCARRRSTPLAVLCGVAGLALGLFTEWRFAPFAADVSLLYFLTHVHTLKLVTLLMLALGAYLSYRFALGRDSNRGPNAG